MLEHAPHERFCRCMARDNNTPAQCALVGGYEKDVRAAEFLSKTVVILNRIIEIEKEYAQTTE